MVLHRCLFCIFAALVLLGSSPASAAPPKFGENAALSYWQAFAFLPELSPEEHKLREAGITKKKGVTKAAMELAAKYDTAMAAVRRGANLPHAHWGLPWELGPEVLMPHLSKARSLARGAQFRADVFFANGQTDEAIKDLLATMAMGRHLADGEDAILISLLVDYAIESVCIQTLAEHLPKLTGSQRAALKIQLAALPPVTRLHAAMQGEKDVFHTWLLKEMKKPNSHKMLVDGIGGEDLEEEVKKMTPTELRASVDRMGKFYDEMIVALKKSPQEAREKSRAIMKTIQEKRGENLMSQLLFPAVEGAQNAELRHLTRLTMLDAGLAVLEQSPAILKEPRYQVPFTEKPMTYQKTKAGFTLTAEYADNQKPVTVTFGATAE